MWEKRAPSPSWFLYWESKLHSPARFTSWGFPQTGRWEGCWDIENTENAHKTHQFPELLQTREPCLTITGPQSGPRGSQGGGSERGRDCLPSPKAKCEQRKCFFISHHREQVSSRISSICSCKTPNRAAKGHFQKHPSLPRKDVQLQLHPG